MNHDNVAINLSEVEIIPIKPKGGHVAFLSFVLNNSFYCGNIALYLRPDGTLRAVYPTKVLPNGKVINLFHPITPHAGRVVLQEAEKILSKISRRSHE